LPKRWLRVLANAKATSDDELDEQTGKYLVRRKAGRRDAADAAFRWIDEERKRVKLLETGRWQERERVLTSLPSSFVRVPKDIALDYFTADYFNDLPASTRRKIIGDKLRAAFSPTASTSSADPTRKLNDRHFMEKHGNTMLKLYNIPGADEGDGDADDSSSDEEAGGMDFDEDDDDVDAEDVEFDETENVEEARDEMVAMLTEAG
jgi:hypothetical protein